MTDQPPQSARAHDRKSLFYGWWIVIIGCIQDAVKGGTYNTGFTLYFLPVLTELGLSRAAMSLPFSLARLESALEGPLVGYLIDRFSPRLMMVLGSALAGLGFVLLSFTHSYVFFLLVFMGFLTLGFQAGFNHAGMAAVNHWFLRRRGLAMSIVQTGQAIGGVVIFPLVALTVLNLGWRSAALFSGILVLAVTPLALLIRPSPESMGLLPDGERRISDSPSVATVRVVHRSRQGGEFTSREAFRTSAFWMLAAFHGLRNVPYAGVSVHMVPMLVWKGLDETTAAFYVGLLAFCTVIVRPLTGWLGDRWSKQWIGGAGVLLGSLGLGLLLFSDGQPWLIALFVILFSFSDAINSVTWALVGDFFGRRQFATIRGWIGMVQSFISMPGAVCTGWIYDRTQSYTYALVAFIVVYGLAALVLSLVTHPHSAAQAEELRMTGD